MEANPQNPEVKRQKERDRIEAALNRLYPNGTNYKKIVYKGREYSSWLGKDGKPIWWFPHGEDIMGHVRPGRRAKEERRRKVQERGGIAVPPPRQKRGSTAKEKKAASDLRHMLEKNKRAIKGALEHEW